MSGFEFDDDDAYVIIERESGGVGSLFMGIAIGAAVALLFAPHSGTETRRRIRRKARRAQAAAQEFVEEVGGSVSETIGSARERVELGLDDARSAIELKKEQVSRAMEAGREAARQAREDLERRIAETKAAYRAGGDVARPRAE